MGCWQLAALLCLGTATASKFDAFKTCEGCIEAGYGWSFKHERCGGYANKQCDRLAHMYGLRADADETFDIPHPGSFLGDDDDMLALMGYRRKCSAMSEVVEHYMDLPYPPRDAKDDLRRVMADPNNTPVAISHHVYNGKKVFPKKGSGEPPFRILVAGGGTGDATVMFSVAFTQVLHTAPPLDSLTPPPWGTGATPGAKLRF